MAEVGSGDSGPQIAPLINFFFNFGVFPFNLISALRTEYYFQIVECHKLKLSLYEFANSVITNQ